MVQSTTQKILTYIEKNHQASGKELVDYLGSISARAVRKQLKNLFGKKKLRKIGTPPRVSYALTYTQDATSTKRTKLDQIKTILKAEKPRLAQEYGVSKVGFFGSFVFGDFNNNSDIDILAEFYRPVGLFRFMALENHLSQVLGRKVDLVSKDGLKSYLKNDILHSTVYA